MSLGLLHLLSQYPLDVFNGQGLQFSHTYLLIDGLNKKIEMVGQPDTFPTNTISKGKCEV